MKSRIIFLACIIILSSCSSTPDLTVVDTPTNSCMEELEKRGFVKRSGDKILQGTKTTASYILTGVGYTGDLLLYTTGGLLFGAGVCLPIAVAGDNGFNNCFNAFTISAREEMKLPDLGKRAYENTVKWRCPEVNYLSRGIRAVSECHLKNGNDAESLKNLKFLEGNKDLYACLTSKERLQVSLLKSKISEKTIR